MPPSTSVSPSLSVPQPRSALSVPRPSSTLSVHRPPSSASSRPRSRLSAHSHARHARSRLIPLAQTLVRQVVGLDDGKGADAATSSDFRETVEFVVKNLEASTLNKGAAGVDMQIMDQQIHGHALKARLNSQDEVGEALETCYRDLKEVVNKEHDLDREITQSHLPDHLQFLIKLSSPPTTLTQRHASSILHAHTHPPSPPSALTWAAIVAEEPFEGEHWEGVYGLPQGFVRRNEPIPNGYDREKESERLDWDSRWSTPSLSPLNSGDLALDEDQEEEERERLRAQKLDSHPNEKEEDSDRNDNKVTEIRGGAVPARIPPHNYSHRKAFEALHSRQYWREGWKGDIDPLEKKTFDMSDASTLGPTLRRVLQSGKDIDPSWANSLDVLVQNKPYINEEDAVREILMALQGRNNIMLAWRKIEDSESVDGYTTSESTPYLLHFSLDAQASILSSLARTATTIQHLRQFVTRVFADAQTLHQQQRSSFKNRPRTTRTLEAFTDAIDQEIRLLDKWCAAREELMCRAWGGYDQVPFFESASLSSPANVLDTGGRLVISLLSTEKALHDTFEQTFDVLLDIVRSVYPNFETSSRATTSKAVKTGIPAVTSSALLNQLFISIQAHLERHEYPASTALLRVFVCSAEPMWGMIGKWLRDGMGYGVAIGSGEATGVWELDDEFFIESSGLGLGMMGLGLLDPEFWKEGYTLRESTVWVESTAESDNDADRDVDGYGGQEKRQKTTPLFLEHIAEPVLSAGKSIGLLRALGVSVLSMTPEDVVADEWHSFRKLVDLSSLVLQTAAKPQNTGILFSTSIDMLSRMIYDRLQPRCGRAGALLAHVLVEECDLWSHLESIEDLFLMRRGDAMIHFTDVLFAKMDALQSWDDFHFLNTAFKDVVESSSSKMSGKEWIQASLVRLTYRGPKDQSKRIIQTVQTLEGLVVEYAVPFPLVYIFQPATLQGYGQIFVFLLQIRRAKYVLDRILVRGKEHTQKPRGGLKAFYAMRSRLSWFTNTLLDFLTIHVLHTQLLEFHEALRKAKSLDEMIQLHENHLDKVRSRCLLKVDTSLLHRAVLSILDLALRFADFFVNFAGDMAPTHDTSHQSISMRMHRSRRQKYQRRNVIGFSSSLSNMRDSSDDDESDDQNGTGEIEHSLSANFSIDHTGEGSQTRMDKLTSELDGLVRYLRRGVESLANGAGDTAPTYGVLAFALEDWDT